MTSNKNNKKVVRLARIQNADGPDSAWTREQFHRVHPEQVRNAQAWRIRPDGVHVFGEDRVRRTSGRPTTMEHIFSAYGEFVYKLGMFDPCILFAFIANEGRGSQKAARYEERLNDYSFGVCQILTKTAYGILQAAKLTPPDVPIPDGGSIAKWRAFLFDPAISIPLARHYIEGLNKRFDLRHDPVLLYAGYNAGSPRPTAKSRWGLIANDLTFPETFDKVAAWYGDACFLHQRRMNTKESA